MKNEDIRNIKVIILCSSRKMFVEVYFIFVNRFNFQYTIIENMVTIEKKKLFG